MCTPPLKKHQILVKWSQKGGAVILIEAPGIFPEEIHGLVCQRDVDLSCNGTISHGLFFFAQSNLQLCVTLTKWLSEL
jgi:hypothetical protein